MSLPTDDHVTARDDSDPLLLFATEPEQASPPEPVVEIAPETAPAAPVAPPAEPPPELVELRHRVETTEHALADSKREVAALRREMATLVAVAKNNYQSPVPRGWPLAAGAAVLLVMAGLASWQWSNAPAPPVAARPVVEAAALPPMPQAAEPAPPQTSAAFAPVAAARLSPRNDAARSRDYPDPSPRAQGTQYVGTLSVDAVPAGGEVFINRKSVGKTPARITGLRAGSHLVWIERAGYRLFTRVVTVPADKVTRVSVALEPTAPVTTVTARP